MTKKIIITISIVLAVLLFCVALFFALIPEKLLATDGGSVIYDALLYSVMVSDGERTLDGTDGVRIEVFGITVCDDTRIIDRNIGK